MPDVNKVITTVTEKISDEALGEDYGFTNSFENVVDSETGYSLSDFLDNYLQYMQDNNFTIVSAEEPTNTHAKIWIDTSSSNIE